MQGLMIIAIASCLAQAVLASYYPWYYGAPVVVTPQGYLADTPEVAAAKAAHFAEVIKAGGVVPPSYYYPVVTPEGFLTDTPEVAAAKAAHFAEKAKAAAAVGAPYYPYVHSYAYPYIYSTAGAPVVTPEGYIADTAEVAAAKAAHFAEHAKAAHRYRRAISLQ